MYELIVNFVQPMSDDQLLFGLGFRVRVSPVTLSNALPLSHRVAWKQGYEQ